mmetsp:Transcript_23923/g.59303  ORF Transcript_23923/g.59303 Transcript_23923/m.59303 type:complete len:215 (-) Transcript_23923:568-1212(-)
MEPQRVLGPVVLLPVQGVVLGAVVAEVVSELAPNHEFLKEAFHGFRRRLGVLLGLQRAAVARDVAEVEVRRQSGQRLGLSRVVAGLVQLEAAAEEVVQGHRRRPLARDRPRHLGHRLASLDHPRDDGVPCHGSFRGDGSGGGNGPFGRDGGKRGKLGEELGVELCELSSKRARAHLELRTRLPHWYHVVRIHLVYRARGGGGHGIAPLTPEAQR